MSRLITQSTSLVAVADAIRTQGDTTSQLVYPDGFVSAIKALPTIVYEHDTIELPEASSYPPSPLFSFTAPFTGTYTIVMPIVNCFVSGFAASGTSVSAKVVNATTGTVYSEVYLPCSDAYGFLLSRVHKEMSVSSGDVVNVYGYFYTSGSLTGQCTSILGATVYATAT